MRDFFEGKEFRRILYMLTKRKAHSICGNRDAEMIKKFKQKFVDPAASKKSNLLASRRSLSIYSERQGEDVKRFEWRYRVKNRDHIPNFFDDPVENIEIEKDPIRRFSTPEKLTYL